MTHNIPVIILGAGGHAKMVLDILQLTNREILGLVGPEQPSNGLLGDLPWLGADEKVLDYTPDSLLLINAVGSVGSTNQRQKLYDFFNSRSYQFANLIHPSSSISALDVTTNEGLQLMPYAVINASSHVGANVLINTHAVIEHDCSIGDHCHIASGATISGGCTLETGVHIGAGATLNQGINIGRGAVIASGAVVIDDVAANTLVAGVPAKLKRVHVV